MTPQGHTASSADGRAGWGQVGMGVLAVSPGSRATQPLVLILALPPHRHLTMPASLSIAAPASQVGTS